VDAFEVQPCCKSDLHEISVCINGGRNITNFHDWLLDVASNNFPRLAMRLVDGELRVAVCCSARLNARCNTGCCYIVHSTEQSESEHSQWLGFLRVEINKILARNEFLETTGTPRPEYRKSNKSWIMDVLTPLFARDS
jgi:hypothetical protein